MGKQVMKLQQFLSDFREEIRECAAALEREKMPVLRQEDFDLYDQNGNRTIYEGFYFSRRMFLAVLGMEAILQKEETGTVDSTVLFRLCDVLEKICGEDTWALPAHVNRRENQNWRETVDLFASETAQTLSELLDRLNNFLPEKLKDRMEEEISRRVLEPYYLSEVPYAGWEEGANNWTAVCAGSIGSAVIHLSGAGRRLPEPLSECLKRVCAAMPYYFQSFTDDGACMEGLQYYTYGMIYFANFAWELKELTGENLFHRPDIAAFPAKCFFPDGVSLSFSDGSSDDTFRVGLQALQALEYGNAEFPAMERAAHLHSDTCYRFAGLKMDWFATKEYLEKGAAKDTVKTAADWRFHILPSAQWCIGSAKNGTGFACKGGHNGESHNHNDIGHLIYEAEGVLFLTDLGAGEYDRDYFSQKRYQAICNSSFGHSVPVLSGQGQREGKRYRCTAFFATIDDYPEKEAADQTFTVGEETRAAKRELPTGIGTVRMEIGSAYSLAEDGTPMDGSAILREIRFDLEDGRAEVTDRFDLSSVKSPETTGVVNSAVEDRAEGLSVMENLVTQILPVIEGNRVYLKQNDAKAVLEVEMPSGQTARKITVMEHDHRNHQGKMEKVYGIRWNVPLKDGRGTGRFSVFLENQ